MSDTGLGEERGKDAERFADRPDLYRGFQQNRATKHFVMLYQSRQERLDAALAFVTLGLDADERCLYITDGSSTQEIYDGLEALGTDVAAARERDQLRVVSSAEMYLDGDFDPGRMAEKLTAAVEESLEDGYEGLRVTGETGWIHREDVPFEDIITYESNCERVVPTGAFVGLCQYDLRQLGDSSVAALLQVHPQVLYRHRICRNPYYQPRTERQNVGSPMIDPNQLLESMYELETANDAIRQREQRVAVLNRVLRHNLRNEMNVIQSHAELLKDTTTTSEQESVETILSTTERLMEIAEDAKRVEKSVNGDLDRVPVDLTSIFDTASERVLSQYPSIDISVPNEASLWVEASDELEFALIELFQTIAALADAGARIDVSVDDACSTPARRCLRVRCQNAHLPDAEVEALTQGRETQLTHGSGLGLWLVNWIVELSGGDLSFKKSDAETDEVVLSFIAA